MSAASLVSSAPASPEYVPLAHSAQETGPVPNVGVKIYHNDRTTVGIRTLLR